MSTSTANPFGLAREDQYAARCAEQATYQGLDPVAAHLRNRGLPVEIEQTGGFCMVAAVYDEPRTRRVWITENEEHPRRYLVCSYCAYVDLGDVDDGEAAWDRDEGTVIAETATIENLPALVVSALGVELGRAGVGGIRCCDPTASVVTVEMEACGDDPAEHARGWHDVRAELVNDGGRYGWPIFTYTGTVAALIGWLECAYEDGSGEAWLDRLADDLRV